MKGLSKKETEIVSWLEFHNQYFFLSNVIDKFSDSKVQKYNIIKNLVAKGRIVKLNKKKYYLIPIKAFTGKWVENSYVLADEICDGRDYIIGGWSAAHYWKLTDQVPMQIDVYSSKKQGKVKILNSRIIIHRTTQKRVNSGIVVKIQNHNVCMQNKDDTERWMKSRK